MTAVVHWLLYATLGAAAIVTAMGLAAFAGLLAVIGIPHWLRKRHLRRDRQLGNDTLAMLCDHCDYDLSRLCTCYGECERRHCPYRIARLEAEEMYDDLGPADLIDGWRKQDAAEIEGGSDA